jgi:hypothetical protein
MNRTMQLLLTPLVLAVVLVACSGTAAAPGVASLDEPSDGASPSPSASVDPEQARLDFARCMREHGIDMPDPGTGGRGGATRIGGGDPEKLQEAMEACREHFQGVMGERGPELSQEQLDAMLEFAQCMREHGIDMPDPGNGGMRVELGKGGIDPESPEFREAQEACDDLLGELGPRVERRVGPGGQESGPSTEQRIGPGEEVAP